MNETVHILRKTKNPQQWSRVEGDVSKLSSPTVSTEGRTANDSERNTSALWYLIAFDFKHFSSPRF